jgi:GT2 family glycosyltransferase
MGDRLTGGGLRALGRRLFERLRETGNRLTGGGLRSLYRRTTTKSCRLALGQPQLDATATTAPIAPSVNLPQHQSNHSLLVNSLYRSALGRLADQVGLADCSHHLQRGVGLEVLAEKFVTSDEFIARHGSGQAVDEEYLSALYRDGLERSPSLENLAFWLAAGHSRARVLAVLASSDEALESLRTLLPQETGSVYDRWVAQNDTIGDVERSIIQAHIAGLPFCPLISVIVSLDKTAASAFLDSLNSVTAQLYPYWELCVTIDEFTGQLLNRVLSDSDDPRIKATELNNARGVAAATNAASKLATGEFVTILRVGDILPEHALYQMAFELGRHDETDIVYADNDQIGPEGKRSNPWFKPGWDPDLLLAQDYISHLVLYRRALVEEVGFLRPEYEEAEFHDLALRATAATSAERIRHIPAILCHRRYEHDSIYPENALRALHGITATHRAVRDHLDSRGDKQAIAEPAQLMPSAIRVVWPIPSPEPLVSVIIPTRDRADLLSQCLDGVLHRTGYSNLEVLIVNNESVEKETFTLFDQLAHSDSRVRILHHPGPFNYSALNNVAAREATGEVLLLLNNDIDVIESGWLRELVSQAIRPGVGLVGAKLLYPNEQVQHAGIALGPEGRATHLYRLANRNDPGYFGQLALPRTLSAVTCACVAIRRAVFFEVGGFDDVNLPVAFNDVDLCLRLGDYGYRVVWTPFAELFHLERASRGLDMVDPVKNERFLRDLNYIRNIWRSLMESDDPFHNPNLLFAWDRFEVPSSPRCEKPWRPILTTVLNLNQRLASARNVA